jgi:16S rRNA (guanine527-N7)-methyltransferase
VFGSRLAMATEYAGWLTADGVTRGLLGPREVPRLWDRHLLNCAAVTELVAPGVSVCDVGSGAGLPGVVMAIRRPDLRVTLVEPLLRRTQFLTEVVEDLDLDNVEVVRGRAESLHGRRVFDVVTSRAVAPLDRLGAWSLPLVASGGALLAMKGQNAQAEVDEAASVMRTLGGARPEIVHIPVNGVSFPTTVVRVPVTESRPLGLAERRARRPGSRRRRNDKGT